MVIILLWSWFLFVYWLQRRAWENMVKEREQYWANQPKWEEDRE